MKKIQFSLFAALAIVFAVSTSFTGKHYNKQKVSFTLPTAWFFTDEPDVGDPNTNEDMAKFEPESYDLLMNLRFAHEMCSEDQGQIICGVQFHFIPGEPNVLLDVVSLSFSYKLDYE